MATPTAFYNPPIELSLDRIINHTTTTKLEHQVASLATTMVNQIFSEVKNDRGVSQWIFTLEQRDEESGKIPDYAVEKVYKTNDELYAKPWLYMELRN